MNFLLHRLPRVFALAALCALAAAALAQTPPGLRLPRNVAPLGYDARLRIDPSSESFSGDIDITVRVFEPTDLVWVNARNLRIQEARAAALTAPEDAMAATVVPGSEDVIGLSFGRVLPAGEVRLSLKYVGAVEGVSAIGLFRQQEAGRWYALTQFEPMDARRVFPCFDEPDRKAPWKLTLTVPVNARAFSNMPVESERQVDAQWREVAFRRTPPLPSYLIAFAVGEFEVRDGGRAGMQQTPITIIAPKGRAAEAAYAAANTGAILAAAERYFGQPYPFPKLDLIAYPKPTFGGAMENPGLITYSARLLLARPDEMSPIFEQRFVGVTAHEIAHMWFGDYVTPAWWNDIWLNESFASWLGTKVVREVRPDWPNSWRSRQRQRAIALDQLASARTLRQPVTENAEVRAAFDGITYAKGEVLLGMIEHWLGPEKFRDGVRRYITKHAWQNATADDFIASLGAADEAVAPAFRDFVERSGVPLLDVALDCSGPPKLLLAQHRFVPAGTASPSDAKWVFPACFDFGDASKGQQACTLVRDAKQAFALPASACPQWVVANRNGVGYYLPRLTPSLYAALPKSDKVLGAADYEALLGDLVVLARAGAVGYDATLAVASRAEASPDPRIVARAAELVDSVPDALVDPPNRPRYAAFVRHHFSDRARAVGWLPQAGESAEVARLREKLAPFVAMRGEDTALARKAQQLAQRWLVHRSAIPPSVRREILVVAARTTDAKDAGKLFDALYSIATQSKDPNESEDAHVALGAFRDPSMLTRAFGLALADGAHDRYAIVMFEQALADAVTRPSALAWMNARAEALMASVPPEQQAELIVWSRDACTERERALFVSLFETRSQSMDGGARHYRQTLEKIDACLALRKLQQQPFNAFLLTAK